MSEARMPDLRSMTTGEADAYRAGWAEAMREAAEVCRRMAKGAAETARQQPPAQAAYFEGQATALHAAAAAVGFRRPEDGHGKP